MPALFDLREPLLVNTIGHSTGVLLFGLFLFLFLQDRRGAHRRRNWLPVAVALAALLWNTGSLLVLSAGHYGWPYADALAAASFTLLSFLPALLFHLALDGRLRSLYFAAYLLSGVAAVLHLSELRNQSLPLHPTALWLITIGFGVLTVVALRLLPHETPYGRSRIGATMCLFLFAMSFVHFSSGHASRAWSAEVALHHAGIPLALIVLLQDYRFLLLDAFLRFIVNAAVAAAFTAVALLLNSQFQLLAHAAHDPLFQGLLAVGACLLLIVFAAARRAMQAWLTRAVLRRPDPIALFTELQRSGTALRDEPAYLDTAAAAIAKFAGAERYLLIGQSAAATHGGSVPYPVTDRSSWRAAPATEWAAAVVPFRFAKGDTVDLLLGRRHGGGRYLSEDLAALGQAAGLVVEQIERFRNSELERLVSQAELRALQSQINPHFLFNAFNTLYGTIARENAEARRTVLNLAEIFRYFLQAEKTLIPLAEELRIVEAYLAIEALRLGNRMRTEIQVDAAARHVLIPTLSIQPLIENAVKHGIASSPEPGIVRLQITATADGIRVRIEDTGHGPRPIPEFSGAGVGLENVRRRLLLCYGPLATLACSFSATGSLVEFLVPREVPS